MTDSQTLKLAYAALGGAPGPLSIVKKNGRVLLALPRDRESALAALRLFQPQRTAAKAYMGVLRVAAEIGIHPCLLRRFTVDANEAFLEPEFPRVISGSCGILLGSPEHHVRRAIASYLTADGREAAKIAFGEGGWEVVSGEAAVLGSLPEDTAGAPVLLGIHRGADISLIRMPYVEGTMLNQGESSEAIALLDSWLCDRPARKLVDFTEWEHIRSALSNYPNGALALERLSRLQLKPAIRHGDFARWNLLRTSKGELIALDWEWGTAEGVPGIDLVHFFAQDARLVSRLPPNEVLQTVQQHLESPACTAYLKRSGWRQEVKSALLACIAFTVGTRQQANERLLTELLCNYE